MSKLKRKIFAGLLLSWAALNPAFGQGPGTAGSAMLDDSPVMAASQGYPAMMTAPPSQSYPAYPQAQYAQAPNGGGYQQGPYGSYEPNAAPDNYGATVPSYADDPAYSNESYVPFDPWGIRGMTRSDIGTGLGYNQGYQTFGGLMPIPVNPGQSILFVNARGVVGYDGTNGFNGGAGFRWYNPDIDRVYGFSAWYDFDDRRTNTYEQFGFSVESLGTYLDFRLNGYFPTNSDQRLVSDTYTNDIAFSGHNIFIGRRRIVQESLRGGDVETGGALPGIGDFGVRGYIGAYYYDGNGQDSGQAVGFKGRLEAMVTEDLWVQLGVTNDRFFGTNTTMAVTLFLPDGAPSRILSRQPTQERLYVPVERNYRVVVHTHNLTNRELAINPLTGRPYYIDYVNNTSQTPGDGTIEHPFARLASASNAYVPNSTNPVDIIYVYSGDGTSRNMDKGIQILENQRLLGEGVDHFIEVAQKPGLQYKLPGDNSLPRPLITNTQGDAVLLSAVNSSSNNEISGFRIQNPAGNGINANYQFANGNNAININNVSITGAGIDGAHIEVHNASTLAAIFDDSQFNSNLGRGLYLTANELSTLTVRANNNEFNSNQLAGAELGLNGGSQIAQAIRFTHNEFSNNNGVGFGFTSTDSLYNIGAGLVIGGASLTNEGNLFDNNVGSAIAINQVGSGAGMLTIQNNAILRTRDNADPNDSFAGDGINIQLNGATATSVLSNSLIDGNLIGLATDDTQAVAGRGIFISALGSSGITNLGITNNIISRPGSDGISIQRFTKGDINNVVIDGNIVDRAQGNGLFIVASGSNVDNLFNPLVDDYTINANQITNSLVNGVRYDVRSDAVLQANMTNNIITGSGDDGINTKEQVNDITDLRQVRGTWTGNTITGNAQKGILLTAAMDLVIGQNGPGLGNVIMNNGNDGIQADGAGSLQIANNMIASNNGAGVRLQHVLDSATLVNNLIQNNTGDGVAIRVGRAGFTDEGVTYDYTSEQLGGVSMAVRAIANTVSNNLGRGFNILNQGVNTLTVQMGDGTVAGGNTVENNGLEGVYAVNTSSLNQTQTDPATTELLHDGPIDRIPIMVLDIQQNTIRGNGRLSDFISTGFVLRVGTATSHSSINNISDWGKNNAINSGVGQVNARLLNNTFAGNLGADFFVQSFTSTVDPGNTQGTWGATIDPVAITEYHSDPLARLNMVFKGNTGDGYIGTSNGSSGFNNGANVGTLAAEYSNAEGTFKSRTQDNPPTATGGPFANDGGDTRRRNAQRVESIVPGGGVNTPAGSSWTYSGMGASTFRIESDFDTAGFSSPGSVPFYLDVSAPPGGTIFDERFIPMVTPPNAKFGEQPYGWNGSIAPGTFQFLIP